ncbi:MAG TPA: hypothetical protein DDZ89_10785 [Clostridiales bacterium]|nr:hypothetical protein [Clostridiales bacterium]
MIKKIFFMLITIMLLTVGLIGCDKTVMVENGLIQVGGTTVDFGKNYVPEGDIPSLKTIKTEKTEEESGLSSELYELTLPEDYTQNVTVTFPLPKDYTGSDDEALLVGIGIECKYDNGYVGIEYLYIPCDVTDKTASASFIPKELTQAPIYTGAREGNATAIKKTVLKIGLFTSAIYYEKDGHFRLYYPTKSQGKFFYGLVGSSGLKEILDDLEKTYEKYKSLGYQYGGDDFPMNVHIKKINDAGSYHPLFGDITLNIGNFTGKYKSGSLDPLMWHEFFHYIQSCYTGIFASSDWIDEATASYYEAKASDVSYTSLTSQYFEKQFVSALPSEDTAQDGYARSPLISFLSKRIGNETWIKSVYEKGGTQEALISIVKDPSGWAHEYYTALALGQIGQDSTYVLHKNISTNGYGQDVGTTLKLNIPKEDEQAKNKSNDEIVLGTTCITMNGQGCRLVAITVDDKELKNLPDSIDPIVECKGASVSVISAIGRNAKNNGNTLTGLKDSADKNTVYLVAVTSQSAVGTSEKFDVKVKLAFEKTDFSGTYTGVLQVKESGADIDVTTVVLYEKDFGDGAYYNIVCSKDDGDSKYINGSYFVRSNGEANIAGAQFVFSPDGQSFSATMNDFSGKAWGTISGAK